MSTLAEEIVKLLQQKPGLKDREITDILKGHSVHQAPINIRCRELESKGILVRRLRPDGYIGNYLAAQAGNPVAIIKRETIQKPVNDFLSEDAVKQFLKEWLEKDGWQIQVAWKYTQGVDIDASKGTLHWLIEAKGGGSRNAMRVNYFLGVIGELLQRMKDPQASYSIAFPDIQQFRNLWGRLPELAKERTKISALFVDNNGNVVHLQ